jgi:hypothetical protein
MSVRARIIDAIIFLIGTLLFKKVFPKLTENAVTGWLDDKIGELLGWSSPDASTVLSWVWPAVVVALVLWGYHVLYNRFVRSPTVAIYTIKQPTGAALDNIISQIPRHLYAQAANAKAALGGRVIFGWVFSIGGALTLVIGILALMVTHPIAKVDSANRVVSETPSDVYPLARAVDAFLAKQGKAPRWGQTAGGPATVGLGSGTGLPDDIYITFWGASLGPWPTVQDGFTNAQLRRFPTKAPKFTTQYDREKYRLAVDDLSKIINQDIGELVRLSMNISGSRPVVSPNSPNGTDQPLETLRRMSSIFQDVHARIFNRGNGSDRSLFDQYPSYKEELLDILPDGWDPIVGAYNVALQQFIGAVMLLRGAERHLDDRELYNMATHNLDGYQEALQKATGPLRDWAIDTNSRIDLTIKAI